MPFKHHINKKMSISIFDTGKNTLTGGRLKRLKKYIKPEKHLCLRTEMGFVM